MSPDDIPPRVTALEGEMVQIRAFVRTSGSDAKAARILASGADQDVTPVREDLRGHLTVIKPFREDHVEFRDEMSTFRGETRQNFEQANANFTRVNANFDQVNAEFGKVHRRLDGLQATVDQIVELVRRPREE